MTSKLIGISESSPTTAEARLRQLLEQERLLATTSQRIRRSLNLDEVLNTAVEEVRQLLQTDRVLLYQFTTPEWAGEIAVESVGQSCQSILGMNIQDNCFRQDHAYLYQDGRVRAISDIHTAEIAACHRELLSSLQVRANLVVPVLHNEKLWGLLIVHHCQSIRSWELWEVDLLRQLSTAIAIAVQQASLVNQLQAQLSERQAIAAALQASQERLRVVISSAPIALLGLNAAGVVVVATGTILHRLGRSVSELLGSSAFEGYAHIPALAVDLRQALAGDTFVSSIEFGGYVFEVRYCPRVDADGTMQGVICVATDVTEQRQAEEALRQSEILRRSEAKNRALLNAIPDAIFRIHRDGTYLDCKLSKMDSSHSMVVVGKRVTEVLPEGLAQQFMLHLKLALQTNQPQVFDYQLTHDREIDYEVRLVVDGADEVWAIVRDISERKKVERLKNEFVSTVSHELRTPLTSIRGSLGLLMGGVVGALPPEAYELVDIASKNSERLILLINDILDIEKIESGTMSFVLQPAPLMPLVEQAIAANWAYAEQFDVTLSLTQTLPEAQVNVDSQRLLQVFTNLLSNAAKFSPTGGTVEVSVTQHNHGFRVSVSDRGCGIPEAFRDRIFQKFAQADSSDARQKGGTGLGLSIARAIVERLNGQLGFTTEVGVGTTFYCDLPGWTAPACRLPQPVEQGQPRSSARILVCEDDPDIATLLKMMLHQAGFHADVAPDAEAAKALLSCHSYQVMTLDLALPGQDGISLIRELRLQEHTRSLPIVVVSAKAEQGREELEQGFAVMDWLEKPIDQERLIAVCQQAIAQSCNP
ncbi:MAG TPA: ATP-binding protein, partial [Thermosynechococcaceae cyanobacterium]